MLLGTWSWRPTGDGLAWFVGQVLPHLPADWRVEVAGSGGERLVGDRRITYRGRVEDAGAFLTQARSVAVPTVSGAGVKVSLLHAIAGGAPVVATPRAVHGLGSLPPTVHVAEDPADFAAGLRAAHRSTADASVARAWTIARARRFEVDVADELDALDPSRTARRSPSRAR